MTTTLFSHQLKAKRHGFPGHRGSCMAAEVDRPLSEYLLIPRLRRHDPDAKPALSDDGFFGSIVSLNLCPGLEMSLGTRSGKDVSYRALSLLDLSVHDAWNIAARNVLHAANTPLGLRFYTREFAGGLQLRTDGTEATSWLTHPQLFEVLDNHARKLLGTGPITYLAPTAETLVVAACDSHWAKLLFAEAAKTSGDFTPKCASGPLIWSNGFPSPL